jgi:hypothetical protein
LAAHRVAGTSLVARVGSISALHLKPGTLLFEARALAHQLHALLEVTLLHELLTLLHELLPVLQEALANVPKLVILLSARGATIVITVVMMVVVMSPKRGHEVRLHPRRAKRLRTELQTRIHLKSCAYHRKTHRVPPKVISVLMIQVDGQTRKHQNARSNV